MPAEHGADAPSTEALGVMQVCKKPVVHEAMWFNGTRQAATWLIEWVQPGRPLGDHSFIWSDRKPHRPEDEWWLWLRTLHGVVEVAPGTWVVKGDRDAWPVDADQFEQTYEVVTDE